MEVRDPAVTELPLVTEDDAVEVAVVPPEEKLVLVEEALDPEPPMETEVEAMGMDELEVAIALER